MREREGLRIDPIQLHLATTHENPGIFGSLLHGMGSGLVPLQITEATTLCDRQVMVSDGVFTYDVTVSISNRIVRPAPVSWPGTGS
mgnify:CR=1 FL=1|jgi:hypothetical protein